jgi:hypothetical protein
MSVRAGKGERRYDDEMMMFIGPAKGKCRKRGMRRSSG